MKFSGSMYSLPYVTIMMFDFGLGKIWQPNSKILPENFGILPPNYHAFSEAHWHKIANWDMAIFRVFRVLSAINEGIYQESSYKSQTICNLLVQIK